MTKAIIGAALALALLVPAANAARMEPESCLAVNPGQPTCSITITSESSSGVVTGGVGAGDWKVVVTRGKKKITFKPPSAEPGPVSFPFLPGDKVTATVASAGGWVLVGHD